MTFIKHIWFSFILYLYDFVLGEVLIEARNGEECNMNVTLNGIQYNVHCNETIYTLFTPKRCQIDERRTYYVCMFPVDKPDIKTKATYPHLGKNILLNTTYPIHEVIRYHWEKHYHNK